jgi:poly-gamma-glutamate capsule biosynthesis protein CapA/YwtB (metallophosphatase superfamily)
MITAARVLLVVGCLFGLTAQSYAQADTTRLSLLFIGDIMQHDSQINAAYDPVAGTYNYQECFRHVRPLFESVDLTIGNLELTLAGPPYKGYPQFSAPDELVYELQKSGIDVLVTANNHCVDRGRKGLERTIHVLDSLRIPHTGTFADAASRASLQPLLVEKNGIRLSLLNYTYGTNGITVPSPSIVNLIDTIQMKIDLDSARAQKTDAIVVFLHWGSEYQALPNKSQTSVAEFCFRNGAKLVIGAHPHVLQPMEWRKESDQLVVYSLGNFVSGQRQRYRDGGGMLFVDLLKVSDSLSSITRIDDAAYELQYVYHNPKNKYVVLPVLDFEFDTTVVRDGKTQALLGRFAADSRLLLVKHNVGVQERKIAEPEYFVTILVDSLHSVNIDSLLAHDQLMKFYSATADSMQTMTLRLGPFPDHEMAVIVQQQLDEHSHCQCARIAERRPRVRSRSSTR